MGRPRSLNGQAVIEHAMEEFWANSDSCCLTAASPARPAEATGLTKGSLCAFSDRRALLDTCLACTSRSPRPGRNRAVIARSPVATARSRAATAGGLRELPPRASGATCPKRRRSRPSPSQFHSATRSNPRVSVSAVQGQCVDLLRFGHPSLWSSPPGDRRGAIRPASLARPGRATAPRPSRPATDRRPMHSRPAADRRPMRSTPATRPIQGKRPSTSLTDSSNR